MTMNMTNHSNSSLTNQHTARVLVTHTTLY